MIYLADYGEMTAGRRRVQRSCAEA